MLRLNLGAGYVTPDNWVNCDIKLSNDNVDYGNLLDGLPYLDNLFDFVLMNHVLQMFTYEELPVVLKEVRRVMKPGATLRILVPDFRQAISKWQEGDRAYFPIDKDLEPTIDGAAMRYIFWHGDTRSAFTDISLGFLLKNNEFNTVRLGNFGDCELDSRKEESLIMEAIK